MTLQPAQVILLFINVNFILLGIGLFFSKKGNTKANKMLAAFLLVLAWVNTHYAFHYTKEVFLNFEYLLGTHMPFLFLLPPMLYFYYKMVLNGEFQFKKSHWMHVVPAIGITMYYLPLFISSSEYKVNFIITGTCYLNSMAISILFFSYFFYYLFRIAYLSFQKQAELKKAQSFQLLRYVRTANLLNFAVIIILLATVILRFHYMYAALCSSVVYFFILYQIFLNPEVFFSLQKVDERIEEVKYADASLSDEVLQNTSLQLQKIINEEQLYLLRDISLQKISDKLNVPPHHLSQVINKHLGLNFNEFVNKHRVEYAKTNLLNGSHSHLTIEAIGKLAGFNTRQTFINAFRKFENSTPSKFLKEEASSLNS